MVWSVDAPRWVALVEVVASSMREDLEEKRRIVGVLSDLAHGAPMPRAELALNAAAWLEQPAVRECDAELIVAVFEAEKTILAQERMHPEISALTSCDDGELSASCLPSTPTPSPRSGVAGEDASLSPALAFLKSSGRRKKKGR